ncbi:hypothetical protein HYE20_00875 [Mycoplasmopsis bovis]|nr:hypothetical protein [Mycoplasmopsis bovis]QQH24517.1 hypothetical protein HYE20_00875 [Mycoplasmopsis bovis]
MKISIIKLDEQIKYDKNKDIILHNFMLKIEQLLNKNNEFWSKWLWMQILMTFSKLENCKYSKCFLLSDLMHQKPIDSLEEMYITFEQKTMTWDYLTWRKITRLLNYYKFIKAIKSLLVTRIRKFSSYLKFKWVLY